MQRETSIEDQLRCCREYADREGWTWQSEHVYADPAISGSSIDGRPGIQTLLKAATLSPRPFDVVLVDDSSRVARDLADALRVLQRLRFESVRVIYLAQQIDSANEQAETLITVHGLVDSLYLREMAAKIRRGIAGQLERGYSTGSIKYGYRAVAVPDPSGRLDPRGYPALLGKRLEIVESEAAIIRRIFEMYVGGTGVPSIVRRLNAEAVAGPRGVSWKFGAIGRLLANEELTGKHIWGRTRQERRPGTRQKVERALPRAEWRIADRPELRIISEELWAAARQRQAQVAGAMRQPSKRLMRGRNAAMFSRHLFSGFLRCGVCGGAVTVVCGGCGTPRYGCPRHSRNGASFCTNRLTIRAKVADAALLAGLQAELLRPDTVNYLADRLTSRLNEVINGRPQQRQEFERQQRDAQERLQRLVGAIESGQGSPTLFQAIRTREAEIATLTTQIAALDEPIAERLTVIPT